MSTPADRVILPDKLYIKVEHCKGCAFCVEFCPKKVLFIAPEFNAKGYHPPGVDPQAKCSNCKLCELLCPEFAIYTLEVTRQAATARATAAGNQAGVASGEEAVR